MVIPKKHNKNIAISSFLKPWYGLQWILKRRSRITISSQERINFSELKITKFKTLLYNAQFSNITTKEKKKEKVRALFDRTQPDANPNRVKSRRPRWDWVWSRKRKRRVQELNAIFNSFCSVRLCLAYRLWPLHINSRRRRRRWRRQQKRWRFSISSISSEGNKTQRFGESCSNTVDQFPGGRRAP